MTPVVQLHREPTSGRRVTRLPLWLPPASKKGVYWHSPRSASYYDDRLSIQMWCGVHFNSYVLGAAKSPPVDLRCGTCLGRRLGYDGAEAIFTPRDHFGKLPTYCPGESGPDGRACFACGAPTRAARGWWTGGEAAHRPAPELAVRCHPCPMHGWKDVRARDGRLVCRTFVGFGNGHCEHDCGPGDAP